MTTLEVYEKLVISVEQSNKQTRIFLDMMDMMAKRIEALEAKK